MIVLHVVIALLSLVSATYGLLKPESASFKTTYSLTGLTLISGTYLVYLQPAHMVSACVSGLFYLSAVGVLLIASRFRLARVTAQRRIQPPK